MMNLIDNFLNQITMYRLVLYYLIALLLVAGALSVVGSMPFSAIDLVASTVFLVTVSFIVNKIFAKTFEAPANFESVYISALILALVITPVKNVHDFVFLAWAATLAISSKYILAIGKKHIFNPVAVTLVVCAIFINQSPTWWVGTAGMAIPVALGGLLIVRKTRRSDMVFTFLITEFATILAFSIVKGTDITTVIKKVVLDSPILFFAFVMLTEPLTTPSSNLLQGIYGGLTGFLFAPQVHFASLYTSPEISLVVANIFSYIVSPKDKLVLTLKHKLQIAPDIYDFLFKPDKKLAFVPGQYMEWTLAQKNVDSRGNRRYFTIASSPTEEDLRLGIKFYQNPSSFKKSLGTLNPENEIVAAQLAGSFTLPKNVNEKLVFVAGGIGITPFRSMIKYLLDKGERRDIVLFYSNKQAEDIVYQDVFNAAQARLGIKTIYTITDAVSTPQNWLGKVGFISPQMIMGEAPDWQQRKFYLSGPRSMVSGFEKVLKEMGVKKEHIKTDFFPGFA